MTEKQFVALTANLRAQSVYQQQIIAHLVGLVHGLKEIIVDVGRNSGMDQDDLEQKFSTAARKMNRTFSEFPFPEFDWNLNEPPSPGNSPPSTPPHEP